MDSLSFLPRIRVDSDSGVDEHEIAFTLSYVFGRHPRLLQGVVQNNFCIEFWLKRNPFYALYYFTGGDYRDMSRFEHRKLVLPLYMEAETDESGMYSNTSEDESEVGLPPEAHFG